MGHHSSTPFGDDDLPEAFRNLIPEKNVMDKLRELQQPFGATNRFPMGKLNEHDEGEIMFGVAADKSQGKIIINFGKPTAWIGMDRQQALDFAALLKQKADDLLDVSK